MFEGLGLPEKEFILPDISSLWMTEEYAVHPDVSDQIELESYPTSILDESFLSEVMRNPSIPLVKSVEAFALGRIDNPFGHSSVEPNVDSSLSEQESPDLKPSGHSSVKPNVDFPLIKQECHDLKPFGHSSVKPNVDFPLIEQESHDLKPTGMDNAECHAVSPDLAHTQAAQGDEIASTADSQASSDNPQLALVNEQSPVAGDQQMRALSAK